MWLADQWNDYEVIDCSKGEKLERWGDYLLVRPDPQVIWDAKEDIALQDLIRELADRYKKNYARTTVVTFVHKIVDKGFATTYRKGKAAYIHPEKSLAAYRDELLQQQLEFWFDGKPSAFLSAWCEKNKLSREEADRIREIIEKE